MWKSGFGYMVHLLSPYVIEQVQRRETTDARKYTESLKLIEEKGQMKENIWGKKHSTNSAQQQTNLHLRG